MLAFDDEPACAKCGKDEYEALAHKPDFALKVAPCGHKICEDCEHGMFRGNPGTVKCPRLNCHRHFTQRSLSRKSLEEQEYENEIAIRAELSKIFTKSGVRTGAKDEKADFKTKREWNDYLEMVERYVYNLVTGVDVETTREKISAYQRENAHKIRQQLTTKVARDRQVTEALERERREKVERIDQDSKDSRSEKRARLQDTREKVDAIVKGEPTFRVFRHPLDHLSFAAVVQMPVYKPDDAMSKEDRLKRRRAGGFEIESARRRAVAEAQLTLAVLSVPVAV